MGHNVWVGGTDGHKGAQLGPAGKWASHININAIGVRPAAVKFAWKSWLWNEQAMECRLTMLCVC